MTVAKSILLFGLAALLEIGGAWLVWQSIREHRGWMWAGFSGPRKVRTKARVAYAAVSAEIVSAAR